MRYYTHFGLRSYLMSVQKKLDFPGLLLVILLLTGGFHEYIACAASAALCVYLIIRISRNRTLILRKGLTSLSVAAICLGYGLSCFWAVDPGMALIGFVKFLSVGLFALCLWQEENASRVLNILPAFAAITVLISALGMQIPFLREQFSVADRLSGFFQYPNTFALFLLICQLLLLNKDRYTLWDWLILAVLVGGLLYTGSRTVFVLFLLSNLLFLFSRQKKARLAVGIIAGCAAVAVVCLLIWGQDSILSRYLTISFTESTFVGRLLYMADALPLLLKHPFGMGYMGYYYSQTAIQTGVYSVAFVHNDFLQLFLDAGLIPGGLFLAAVVACLFRKGVSFRQKLPMAVLCLHSLLDFNLQYVGMFCLLLLLMEDPKAKTVTLTRGLPVLQVAAAVLALLSLYIGTATALSHFRQYAAADALYPYNTQTKLSMLEQEDDLENAVVIAHQILKQNTTCYVPYSILAKHAYSQGDFAALIENKNTVFSLCPFGYEEYEEYCIMLINGIYLYHQAGDAVSVQVCQSQLLSAQAALNANQDRLSTLGRLIVDQPVTQLSEEVRNYIDQLG